MIRPTVWLAAIIALVASPAKVLACAVCYGAAEGPFIRGLQLSVIALLGVTYFVIGGLLACFLMQKRRVRIATRYPFSPPPTLSLPLQGVGDIFSSPLTGEDSGGGERLRNAHV